MRKLFCITFIIFLSCALVSCFGFGMSDLPTKGNIALVEVKGTITTSDETVFDLEKARKSKRVKAVVIRVDSPGGAVAASQEIFRTVKKLDEKKPVVVSMGDVAASGGYYVSAGARKIFANEGTVTGSIGVRLELLNAKDLFEWMKLRPETLKSGRYKDIGSIYRELNPEERDILDTFLAELHEQFKSDVSKARSIDKEKIDKIADGRVYSGNGAKELGLIDEIGGYLEAVQAAADYAGIKGEPKVVRMRKSKPWWVQAFSEDAKSFLGMAGVSLKNKYFLYEWRP